MRNCVFCVRASANKNINDVCSRSCTTSLFILVNKTNTFYNYVLFGNEIYLFNFTINSKDFF